MPNLSNNCQYLRDGKQPTIEQQDPGKIIFLFFSSEKDAYLRWLQAHGRRPETILDYRKQLDIIAPVVMQTVGSLRFDEIGEDEVYTLIDALDGVCERTRKTYITTFGRLCAFVTGTNPVNRAQVIWGDCEPTHRIFIDSEDWPRIKDAARSSTDRLILYLGAYMGLRREEMVRIRMQDIDGDYLIIHGKGHGQDGSVVRKQMPQPVRTALRVYLGQRQELHPDTDQLLIRIDGRQPGRVMDGRSIRFAVDNMSERSGVKFTPHSLRRLYATTMWEATGKDLVLTKTATRHASADVLMDCYINANPAGEREAVDRMLQMIRRASHYIIRQR